MVSGRSWSLEARRFGQHVMVRVRCGTPGSRALCGVLTMTLPEWSDFKKRFNGGEIKEEDFA